MTSTVKSPAGAPGFERLPVERALPERTLPERTRTSTSTTRAAGDSENQRRAIRQMMVLAGWVWPSFALLDVFMSLVSFPQAPLGRFLMLRVLGELFFVGAYRLTFRPTISVPRLAAASNTSLMISALLISVMALDLGGLNSSYVHGISIVIFGRAVLLPGRWRSAVRYSLLVALAFPAVMGIAAAFSPDVLAAWRDPSALGTFAGHYVFVLGSALVGSVGSHAVWAAQQQVYQARKLGRYRLEAPIGSGGMSEVWLAWDETLRRKVAVKILRTTDAVAASAIRRFEQEAYAASKLEGPHTIRVFDFGASDDGIYYIAMEHLRGADLGAITRAHGAMPIARATRFAGQACLSLIEAHEAGIIHRDVKPQNLYVTRAGDDYDFLKLLDFGIARLAPSEEEPDLTRVGEIKGTPAYMAPEVWRGEPADARSDLYALGATLHFLLTGEPPFAEARGEHICAAHLTQDPPPPSKRRGEAIPEALEQIVLRCLAKAPADRFQTARELHAALAALAIDTKWTAWDAKRFWTVIHPAKLDRMDSPTR